MDENFNINNGQDNDVTPENEEKNDIRFEVKETVNIVPAETKNKNNKTTVIVVIAVILVAIVCGLVFFFVQKDSDGTADTETTTSSDSIDYEALEDAFNAESFTNEEGQSISSEEYKDYIQNIASEATTLLNENTANANPHSIVEKTTVANENSNENQTEPGYDKAACEALIKSYLDRSCYLEGSLDNEPIAVAFDGDNFEMLTSLEGMEVSLVKLDGKLYFKRTALMQYAQLTDAVMQTFGLSIDMLNFDFGDKTYEDMKNHLTSVKPVIIDGKDGVCFRYDKNGGFFNFYFADDELVQVDIGEGTEITSQFVISYFTASIPGDMLSLKGYKETGFMTMFADYM
ncbi:MAG: hypothetical protein IJZ35_05710 [Clostridia bacterium]|nr:hypothetical protein [Clostridia bacterium]